MKKYFNKLNEDAQDIHQYGDNIIDNYFIRNNMHGQTGRILSYRENFYKINKKDKNIDNIINACKYNKDKIVFFYLKDTSNGNIWGCSIDSKLYELSDSNNIYFIDHYDDTNINNVKKAIDGLARKYNKNDVIIIDDIIEGDINANRLQLKVPKFVFINKDLADFYENNVSRIEGEDYKGINIMDYYNWGYECIVVYFIAKDIYNIYNSVPNCYLQCAITAVRINDSVAPYVNLSPYYIYSNNPTPDDLIDEIKDEIKDEKFSTFYPKVVNNYKLL